MGLGLTLPLYVSGPSTIGYWGVCITMLADLAAFVSLVFGYFYFWTIHEDFPPEDSAGPVCSGRSPPRRLRWEPGQPC